MTTTMTTTTTLEQISTEKQRIMTKLASIDTQRAKLDGELDEIEAAERVMARYGAQPGVRRRGRPQKADQAVAAPLQPTTKTAAKPAAQRQTPKASRSIKPRATPRAAKSGPTLDEKILAVVTAAPSGILRTQVLKMSGGRANHIGAAIVRHIKYNRIVERNGMLYLPAQEFRQTG